MQKRKKKSVLLHFNQNNNCHSVLYIFLSYLKYFADASFIYFEYLLIYKKAFKNRDTSIQHDLLLGVSPIEMNEYSFHDSSNKNTVAHLKTYLIWKSWKKCSSITASFFFFFDRIRKGERRTLGQHLTSKSSSGLVSSIGPIASKEFYEYKKIYYIILYRCFRSNVFYVFIYFFSFQSYIRKQVFISMLTPKIF